MKKLHARAGRQMALKRETAIDAPDASRLQRELELHQLELEIQNEELRRARDEVETSLREKWRVYRALSHDLAQPVLALRLFSEALLDGPLEPAQREVGARIAACAAALNEISRALSALSAQSSEGSAPQCQPVFLGPLLERAFNNHLPVAARKGLRTRVVPTTLAVHSDPVQLGWILGNLIANAVQYTLRGGVLAGVRRIGSDAVRIEVWDTGIGIDADDLPRIFDEYYQCGNAERNPDKGFGIGLAVARRLAENLGLTLRVRSVPRHGSVFTLTIPRAGARLPPALHGNDSAIAIAIA